MRLRLHLCDFFQYGAPLGAWYRWGPPLQGFRRSWRMTQVCLLLLLYDPAPSFTLYVILFDDMVLFSLHALCVVM